MNDRITARELRAALGADFDALVDAVVEAVNTAEPGRIIADSEEPVRDAVGAFRQALYQRAIELRQRHGEPAFSPSQDRANDPLAEQGPTGYQLSDRQRPH